MDEGEGLLGLKTPGKKISKNFLLQGLAVLAVFFILAGAVIAVYLVLAHQIQSLHQTINELKESNSQLVAENDKLEKLASNLQNQVSNLTQIISSPKPPCGIQCSNGGYPTADCTACTGCNAGWTGTFCSVPESCSAKCSAGGSNCNCLNGGTLDSETCSCKCLKGWKGSHCQGIR